MNRPIISVVIPVYNVEAYIERCVNSVRNQTVENIEIILIDDGSPDQSPVLCDQYAEKDRRVRVIHKKNGGLASARNRGITVATGKYIFFLDSDDWLEKDGLQQLYELAQKYQVDFVRYRAFRTEWPGMERNVPCRVETVREMQGGIYDRKRILQEIYPRLLATRQLTLGPVVGACGALYRTDFLKKNQIFFSKRLSLVKTSFSVQK
ncbi:glycosyltransferase family 2 protein [Blautia sp. OM05-6]|jgi:glycosyltransferase involved in cell wall biosynthesis|uniref:glycosyltransferase family 2 protein n=1 Tax=Blautia sp. OM05-6 TaxID=2292983 RepID=UPI000E537885|nr:glycosyltransferase family 2 protein [Blautia sp. OM05-6]RHV27201.1 glycosyltransferase family 2 protein [Blautia sp. OM05-6]